MLVIDSQLHEPAISLEWAKLDERTRWHLLTEVQLAYMQAIGVDRALLYPLDSGWGQYARALMPERFALVTMVGDPERGCIGCINPAAPNIGELIGEQRDLGVVAIRVVRTPDADWLDRSMPAIQACANERFPIFLTATGDLKAVAKVAGAFPDLPVILDHIGLPQVPGEQPECPAFRSLPEVLELAAYPNVAVKLSSAVSLSAQSYPFTDVWPHLMRLVETFGSQRLMWASDISRYIGRVGFDFRMPDHLRHEAHESAQSLDDPQRAGGRHGRGAGRDDPLAALCRLERSAAALPHGTWDHRLLRPVGALHHRLRPRRASPPRGQAGSDPGVRYRARARAGGSQPHRIPRAASPLTGMLARLRPRPYPDRETARKDRMCASKARKIMSRPMT